MASSSRKKSRAALVLAAITVVTVAILNMTATVKTDITSYAVASGPSVVTVTRVVSKFEDRVRDGAQSVLASESSAEVVLSVRDGFVLERGVVAEASTGVVLAVSGGCCLEDATVYSPGEEIEVQYQPSPAISRPAGDRDQHQQLRVASGDIAIADEAPITSVCILEHSHSETYYHFLIEALPRLEHVWGMVSRDDSVRIFQTSIFAPSTFALLGLGQNRACGERRTVYPTVLIPPPMQDPRDEATVTRVKSMAGRLVAAAGLADTGPDENPTWVVINRAGAKARQILNHEELMTGLRESFPEVVFREFGGGGASNSLKPEGGGRGLGINREGSLGEGSHDRWSAEEDAEIGGVEKSIRAFRSCWGVIAPHGAGLSNLVFLAKSNAPIVEIVGENQTGKVYEALAGQFEHRHMYITAPHVTWQRSHMLVDVPAVLEAVAPLFE